jgi:hypothetical protein
VNGIVFNDNEVIVEYLEAYIWKNTSFMFKKYISHLTEQKKNAKEKIESGNDSYKCIYNEAKLCSNVFYGKCLANLY